MAQPQKQDIDLGITRFEYGDASRKQTAVLTVITRKGNRGGLLSSAQVFWIRGGCRQCCIGLSGGNGDYHNNLMCSEPTVKAIQKAIDRQHAQVFTAECVALLTERAKAHYAAVVAAGVDGFKNTYPQEVTA